MVNSKDLNVAVKLSRLRFSVVEEQIVLASLMDIDKRIDVFLKSKEREKEAREPYEFG